MKIILYIPGMPFDGSTIEAGESLGGSETMGFYVAEELAKNHLTICFCNVPDGKEKMINNVQYKPIGQQSERFPFGDNFENYATNIPHDVLIAQRAPGIFGKQFNSKINYWWTHDLALKRYKGHIDGMMWNCKRLLAVSDWHKDQVKLIYGLNDDSLGVLPNGIDLNLYPKNIDPDRKILTKTMLYSHRPERGLINLVKEGGIMEQLHEFDPEIKLAVASYNNNHPNMSGLYQFLYSRCEQLPNVQNAGYLSKRNLAKTMSNIWLHVYPTEFEETSCITMMEEQAGGTPVVTTKTGALSETLENGGVYWTELDKVTDSIKYLAKNPDKWKQIHKKAIGKASDYSKENSAKCLEEIITKDFDELCKDKKRLYHHFVYNSDIKIAEQIAEKEGFTKEDLELFKGVKKDFKETTDFYEDVAQYNIDIDNNHDLGNFEPILDFVRLKPILQEVNKLKPGSRVLDYGCCVGQITFALADHRKDIEFIGAEISKKQVDIGNKFKDDNNVKNCELIAALSPDDITEQFDLVICTEVLEHIYEHKKFLSALERRTKQGCKIILSTPYGPIEQNRPERNHILEHVHHFEEQDIIDMVGHKTNMSVTYTPAQDSIRHEKIGSYVWSWEVSDYSDINDIDYNRKLKTQNPKQSLSCCMIVGPDGDSLGKTLESVKLIVDEFIIGIDGPLNSRAAKIARRYNAKTFTIVSPLKSGFDEARNATIRRATKDWILWIDDDEIFTHPERILKYLTPNFYDSYGTPQHHFTAEPPGLMKTDFPTRVYRNGLGVKFFGVVHEHPEIEMNKGINACHIINPEELSICHNGYETEEIRRIRFQRNWPLMKRDHQKYPDRTLGRFLWIRDLAHMNRFIREHIGGNINAEMVEYAKEALSDWRKLLDLKFIRLIVDSLQFIYECSEIVTQGNGYHFKFGLDLNRSGLGDPIINGKPVQWIEGQVETSEDLKRITDIFINNKIDGLQENQKYS